jgi:DDE superfamily endonuclease
MFKTMVPLMSEWEKVFSQKRTARRAINQAISSVCVLGNRTIARSYLVRGVDGDWSSEYKLYWRSQWDAQALFNGVLSEAIKLCPDELLPLGTDDTRLKKSGKKIPTAHWGRDPLSPPFHVNLQYGLRFLHTALLAPHNQKAAVGARALPVWFEEAPVVKKPGKKATPEEQQRYREEKKQRNLSVQAVSMFKQMRQKVDDLDGQGKTLAFAVDGSYCNRTIFKAELERTAIIARGRKDAKLCFPVREGRRRYSVETFTPEQVLKDSARDWSEAKVFHGGKERTVEYKEVNHVLWRRGGGTKPVRLIVVKPVPYRKTKAGRLYYREPAFLLTTDLSSQTDKLLQIYFDRWQVEVAHRELKDTFGLGQAQVRVPSSVARQPALTVATYSIIHFAALAEFGYQRSDVFGPIPKYQKEKTRVSGADLIRYLRNEVVAHPELLPEGLKITEKSILGAATI